MKTNEIDAYLIMKYVVSKYPRLKKVYNIRSWLILFDFIAIIFGSNFSAKVQVAKNGRRRTLIVFLDSRQIIFIYHTNQGNKKTALAAYHIPLIWYVLCNKFNNT